jgi:signal transduction histidine kinase
MTPVQKMSVLVKAAPGRNLYNTGGRVESVDIRMLVLLRCVLACSAFVILWIDTPAPREFASLTFGSVAVYCAFSLVLASASFRSDWPAPGKVLHWADVLFYGYMIALTGGIHSLFFLYFFYSILVAAFSWGFREGMLVTVASLVFFAAIGLAVTPAGENPEVGRALVRAGYLLIFGYTISYLGGYQRLLRGRLALLKELTNRWNPRFGVDNLQKVNLERLLDFYGGQSCVLVLRRPTPVPEYVMYSATRDKPGKSETPSSVAEGAASALLRLPDTLAAYYHDPAGSVWRRFRGYSAYDLDLKARTKTFLDECAVWATLLDTNAFVTVPYLQRDGTAGRLFLTAERGGFTHADIDFLAQASDAMSTVVENTDLVEELIFRAAQQERFSISRDLHDTTIQPYIGLKLALEALLRESSEGNPLSRRISELVEMAELTIRDLRDYATTLKERTPMPGSSLVAAVAKHGERLGRFYGIEVEVTSDISPRLTGRLAAEAFQIISEGLSNVLRHTTAKRAFVAIVCESSCLQLRVGNELGAGAGQARKFTPRSVSERVQMLGGEFFVEHRLDGYTVVHVKIPYESNGKSA